MKKIVLALALIGCGDGALESDSADQVCHVHSEGYSHTVMFCGEDIEDNVEDVFITCDARTPRSEQYEGCIGDIDLMDLTPDCSLKHICLLPWTQQDEQS